MITEYTLAFVGVSAWIAAVYAFMGTDALDLITRLVLTMLGAH
jgi:hypothetical protein